MIPEDERESFLETLMMTMCQGREDLRTSGRSLDDGPAADIWRNIGDFHMDVYVCLPPELSEGDDITIKYAIGAQMDLPVGLPLHVVRQSFRRVWFLQTLDLYRANERWGDLFNWDVSHKQVVETQREIESRKTKHSPDYGWNDFVFFSRADQLNALVERRLADNVYYFSQSRGMEELEKWGWNEGQQSHWFDGLVEEGDHILLELSGDFSYPYDPTMETDLLAGLLLNGARKDARKLLRFLVERQAILRRNAQGVGFEPLLPKYSYGNNSIKFTTVTQFD